MRILLSDEKPFDTDGVYNVQNDLVWASSCVQANKNGGIKMEGHFSQKVIVWLDACLKRINSIGGFRERHTESRLMHKESASSGSELRKQGF